MEDRELLELAAKAAGMKSLGWSGMGCLLIESQPGKPGFGWNPLVDDGDALRLAVKLRLTIVIEDGSQGSVFVHQYERPISSVREDFKVNPDAAVRRAIVRAAAEIGKAL